MIKIEEYKDLFIDVLKNNKKLKVYRNFDQKPTAEETYDFVAKKFNADPRKGKSSDDTLIRYWTVVKVNDFFSSQLRKLDSKKKLEIRILKYQLWIDFLKDGNSIYNFCLAFCIDDRYVKRYLTRAISFLNEHTGTSYTYEEFKSSKRSSKAQPVQDTITIDRKTYENLLARNEYLENLVKTYTASIPKIESIPVKKEPVKQEPEKHKPVSIEPVKKEPTAEDLLTVISKTTHKLFEDKALTEGEYNFAISAIGDSKLVYPKKDDNYSLDITEAQFNQRTVLFEQLSKYIKLKSRYNRDTFDYLRYRDGSHCKYQDYIRMYRHRYVIFQQPC